MQSELLASETRRREMETGVDVIQTTLRKVMNERDDARTEAVVLAENLANTDGAQGGVAGSSAMDTSTAELPHRSPCRTPPPNVTMSLKTLKSALLAADEMAQQIALMQDQNDQIFRQLEEAMTISVEPLDKMFRAAGMNTDNLLNTVRRGYSGQGGPLTPLSFSTRGRGPVA